MKLLKRLLALFGSGRLIAAAVLTLLLALRIADPVVTQNLRNQSFDLYQRIKPRDYVKLPVAILDIDEASIEALGQWPWPRTRIAELVTRLNQAGVAATAFDIVFSEKDRLSPDQIAADNPDLPHDVRQALQNLPSNDARLADAIATSRIVTGQTSVRSETDKRTDARPMDDVPHAFLGPDPVQFMRNYPKVVQNLSAIEDAASGHGIFTAEPDPDGIFRKVALVMMAQDQVRLFLSAELLRVATGGGAFAVKSDAAGITGLVLAKQFIQTDREGAVWPWLSRSRPERFVSAKDLLDGSMPPARLRGHLVLVGTSAVGLEDYRATPLATPMAGVEIHAQVIENMMAGTMLYRPNTAALSELMTILGLGLLVIILAPFLSAMWTALGGIILLTGYVAVSWYLFDTHRILLDPAFPVVSTGLTFMVMATASYLGEERKRAEIRSAFGQYVSPKLVDRLANNPEALALGGETRELSVLFSDVRGFTAISESFRDQPQGLTVLMNKFLTVLSDAILKQDGTIDKFMGDAVMAFWNAPLDQPDHARAACLAAIGMIEDVAALNAETKAEHEAILARGETPGTPHHAINVGIGINTGQCVVGNMGSRSRFDYTALGDTVNIASRLEGQSKPYGVKIVIGKNTAAQVKDEFALLEIDLIRVKGKKEPERIYGLYGAADVLNSKPFQDANRSNNAMLSAYRKRDWETAEAELELLKEVDDENDYGLAEYIFIYENRIAEFSENPPGANWDGVYTAESK